MLHRIQDAIGTNEMQNRIRSCAWPSTSLGAPETWPSTLKATVTLILDAKQPMWICWGPDLLLLYNDAYMQILGARHTDAFLQPFEKVWHEIWHYLGPVIKNVLAGNSTFTQDVELVVHRNGYEEQALFTYSMTPLRLENGNVAGFLGVAMETTSHVLLQRRKAAEAERLKRLFEQAPSFMCLLTGPNHRVEVVNDAYLSLIGQRDVLNKNLADALPETVEQGFISLLDEVYESGKVFKANEVLYVAQVIPDESAVNRYVNFIFQPVFDDTRKVTGIFVEGSDVTEQFLAKMALQNANEKLRESDIRKDEFLAMLAHELRNPLAPISSAAELLQRAKFDESLVRQASQIIGRQVHHMIGMVDDLLDVSRVTRGLVELDKVTLDIRHVVADAVEQVSPLIRARRQELTLRLASQPALVKGDRKRLVQVLANVLNNAAKYTAEGGHITLCTSVRDSHVVTEVIDDGIGMIPEMAQLAFDLFAQAQRTSDRASGGLGLGLALVKSLVNLHEGTVSCKSSGLGQGSTFSICLPRLLIQEHPASVLQTEETIQPAQDPSVRILVVDDNVDAAEMLKLLLEAKGHEVMIEHGPYQALERAKLYRPQVCLIDIGLPDIDGNELARRLRAQSENILAVLVAVTGYGQESDREKSLAAGFDHHLVKPIDLTMLTSILSTSS